MEAQGTTPDVAIEIRGLWAGYDNESVLEDINLTIRQRDFVGLIGPNGGGKTTLIKVTRVLSRLRLHGSLFD